MADQQRQQTHEELVAAAPAMLVSHSMSLRDFMATFGLTMALGKALVVAFQKWHTGEPKIPGAMAMFSNTVNQLLATGPRNHRPTPDEAPSHVVRTAGHVSQRQRVQPHHVAHREPTRAPRQKALPKTSPHIHPHIPGLSAYEEDLYYNRND
jgi:hypothetical protein